jgi:hypothetical protein
MLQTVGRFPSHTIHDSQAEVNGHPEVEQEPDLSIQNAKIQ